MTFRTRPFLRWLVVVISLSLNAEETWASHVAPYQCGVTSASFARICRPNANTSCLGAAARGVKGFSTGFCAARHIACVSCLGTLKRCISRIGHAPHRDFSCDECTGKFSRCIGRRYPPALH